MRGGTGIGNGNGNAVMSYAPRITGSVVLFACGREVLCMHV